MSFEQPFRSDVDYYEGRAEGIATTSGVTIDEARGELARRHGFSNWRELLAHIESLPETPFVLAYQAIELQTTEDPLDAALRRVLRAMKV